MTLWWTIATAAAAGSSIGFGGGLVVLTVGWDVALHVRERFTREQEKKRKAKQQRKLEVYAAEKVRTAKLEWDWKLAEWKRANGINNDEAI